jgi:hypothetical protein
MAKTITISLDDASVEVINKLKEKTESFNLSGFLQEKIKSSTELTKDTSKIEIQIAEKKMQIDNLKNEVDYLEETQRKILREKEFKIEQELKAKEDAEKQKIYLLNRDMKNILFFYDVSEIEAQDLALEFHLLPEETKTGIIQFMERKGYKQKESGM